ncbi:MAG TPA: ComEC/Rec2 family competence protein [Saprospiraceae bacterium]|nr:ComEC/Rec2 family competence protein [Saprospiraceae bacterium]HMQ82218.1 ComEC/Rec2 family competence protein [Saprospiraceae bacterium]
MINWRATPMIRVCMAFIIGIVLSMLWPLHVVLVATLVSLLPFLGILTALAISRQAFRYRWLYGLLTFLAFLSMGYDLAYLFDERLQKDHFTKHPAPIEAYVGAIQKIEPTEKRLRLFLSAEALIDSTGKRVKASGNLLAYLPIDVPSRQLKYGDRILLQGRVQVVPTALNPKAFDYARYLHLKNIHYQVFVRDGDWQLLDAAPNWRTMTDRLRQYCLDVLRAHLPTPNEFSVGAALMMGYKSEISDEVQNAYSQTGAMHVLAVSGLHVGLVQMIAAFVLGLLPFKGRRWVYVRTGLLLFCIWGFAFLTGASPSVLRAAGMFSFLVVGLTFRRHTNIYNTLAASAFFLLCFNPFLVFDVGFQLSYLAVLGIVYFQPIIYRQWYVSNKLGDYFWKLTALSIAAQLTTFPLSIYYFHQFPLYFFLSGLVVVPAAGLILGLGILLFFVQGVPFLGLVVGKALWGSIWLMNALVFLIQQIPGGLLQGIWIGLVGILLIYFILAFGIAAIQSKQFKWVNGALFVLALLLVMRAAQKWGQVQQKQLVVYHQRQETLIDILEGKDLYVLADEPPSEASLRYTAMNFRQARGVGKARFCPFQDTSRGNQWLFHDPVLQFGDYTLLVINGSKDTALPEGLKFDGILIRNNPDWTMEALKEKVDFQELIADGSNGWKTLNYWEKVCKSANVHFHNTALDGAFMIIK